MLVIQQMRAIGKIYDLLALCSAYILMELEKNPYEFALFKDDEFEFVYDAIIRYCEEVKTKGHRAAFTELQKVMIEFMCPEATIEKCFAVVKYIDELVGVEFQNHLWGGKQVTKYEALNESYREYVRILPKANNTLADRADLHYKRTSGSPYSLLRDKRECPCSVLDSETLNYMIWDQSHIERFPMFIYHLNKKHPIYEHFDQRQKIVFGIVPFTSRPAKEILDMRYEQKIFYIEKMHEDAENELRERYIDIYNRSRTEDIDFLIFPEMLITEKMIASIDPAAKVESPQIIINGSIWKDAVNRSTLTDGKGREIFSYCKKTPYIHKIKEENKEYREYLDSSKNKEYAILEIDGVGRIGVGICKDLINEEFKMFHRHMGTDILLIPAYTKSMDLHASAAGMATEYNCIVVVANACSALGEAGENEEKRRIGFVSIPSKGDERAELVRNYTQEKCMAMCDRQCVGRKISIDFFRTKKYGARVSYFVTEDTF